MDRNEAIILMQDILLCTHTYFDSFGLQGPSTSDKCANGYKLYIKGPALLECKSKIEEFAKTNNLAIQEEIGQRGLIIF